MNRSHSDHTANKDSAFFCTQCGKRGLPVIRFNGKKHEPGHLKVLYCPYCKKTVNACEVNEFGKYTYADFAEEFEQGNFDAEGVRKIPYKQFYAQMHDFGGIREENECR